MSAGPHSVDRALEILDVVADSAGPVGAKALARHLDCSLSTVYHLLAPLVARGHLVRTGQGYVTGARAVALHRAHRRHLGVAGGTGAVLARLSEHAGAEAYFTAYRDGLITVLDSTAPDDGAQPFAPGPELRAHATAHGKALLARVGRAERRRYLDAHGMARFTERTITASDRFEAEVQRVRARGYAVSVGEADPGHTCLAVALTAPCDGPVHALSVSVPTADFRRRHGTLRAALAGAARIFPTLPESG
ncbi:IclR family transcriptional regulator C-terminal domain-containing protein [Streptomyces sp. NPDC001941]|uniref:IclR family transcriptional regulator n=1 Tax=Streptomyces sp. NPDC001941 TaxID=3154659 RepID=UPI00332B9B82